MRPDEPPPKQDVFLALLQEGTAFLHLDARRPGVVVPSHLRGEPHLVLQYGRDLPVPIPDLDVDVDGVKATLSFARMPQLTVVPWSAVYVVRTEDGRGVLYHDDVPEDISLARPDGPADNGKGRRKSDGSRAKPAEARAARPATADEVPAIHDGDSSDGTAPPRRPSLRLVAIDEVPDGLHAVPVASEQAQTTPAVIQSKSDDTADNDGPPPPAPQPSRPTLRIVK